MSANRNAGLTMMRLVASVNAMMHFNTQRASLSTERKAERHNAPIFSIGRFSQFTAPGSSRANAGFKRNRRAELKRSARRAAR